MTQRRGVPRCGAAPRAQLSPVGFWRRRWVPARRPGSVCSLGQRRGRQAGARPVLSSDLRSSGAGTPAPAPLSPAPSPRCRILYSFRAAPTRSEGAPPPRSPLSRTVLRCARPHCAVPAAAVRERRSERRGRPPPTAPAPRWGAEGWGKRALCSALAADRHLAPRSQICRASISPPSADLRLGSVGLFCCFFFFPSRPRIFIAEEDKLSGRAGSARPHAAEERWVRAAGSCGAVRCGAVRWGRVGAVRCGCLCLARRCSAASCPDGCSESLQGCTPRVLGCSGTSVLTYADVKRNNGPRWAHM